MDELTYQAALNSLHDARLILTTDPAQMIDCHPLVREHFAATATRDGHTRLYEHYTKQAPPQPGTLAEMTPLFYAVYHGCQAGQHQAVLDDAYKGRIYRGNEAYLVHRLGAFGIDLSLLAGFFQRPWTQPIATLLPYDRAWVMSEAGFALRAVGRLADAVEPMRIGAEVLVELGNWKNAASAYNNLGEIHATLGNVSEAVAAAMQSIDFADRSGDCLRRIISRSTLADALRQSTDLTRTNALFEEAERFQAESAPLFSPPYAILNSISGYRYCDFLLGHGQTAEVLRRATQTLLIAERHLGLLPNGLDHLSLGRAHPSGSAESTHHLDRAVDFLRRAGRLDYLPLALLARGTLSDLDEGFRVATRSGMRLHLTDYHLASARLALANNDRPKALDHFAKAESLIQETGYHRRDPDLAELRPLCT
jgi:tetratricopeptide (TPR) repeat protein